MAIKKLELAADMLIPLCNEKTVELKQSLNTNVANVFRLEKEHALVFGARHVAAYGNWYETNQVKDIDPRIVVKTVKFLERMFDLQKHLGRRKADGGSWYFQSNDPNLLICATVKRRKVYGDAGLFGPGTMMPFYLEVFYVARAFLDLPPDHREKSLLR